MHACAVTLIMRQRWTPGIRRTASIYLLFCCSYLESHNLSYFNSSIANQRVCNVSLPSYVRPRVLLFIHVPKCGGTTVRTLFHKYGWHVTYWALSQRLDGWKANQMLHAIKDALLHAKNKVFVEWHVNLDWSVLPVIERHVRIMCPDVDYRAWTILRPPTDLLVSNGVYWQPHVPPELVITIWREYYLFNVFQTPHDVPKNDTTSLCNTSADLCRPWTRFYAGLMHMNTTDEQVLHLAGHKVAVTLARADALTSQGCDQIINHIMTLVAPLHSVLWLNDNHTMRIIHAVADGADTFEPQLNVSPRLRTPHSATSNHLLGARYKTPELTALMLAENNCSIKLYGRLRSKFQTTDSSRQMA